MEMNRKTGVHCHPRLWSSGAEALYTRAHSGLWPAKEPREWARGLETPQQKTGEHADWAGIGFLLISPTSPEPPS